MLHTPLGDFEPVPFLLNPHAMTLFPRFWPRHGLLLGIPAETRLFSVTSDTQIQGICHWQPDRKASKTLVVLHGLEGCAQSHYMQGIATKAWRAGCNVIRLNQRNCGGTEHLTPTLYNSALSGDYRAVIAELSHVDGLDRIWAAGYSMGGNLMLKMAGEVGSSIPSLQGIAVVCPNIEPLTCVTALERPTNWIYHRHFLQSLKARLQRKTKLFPGKWDASPLPRIRTLREFDNRYTAPDAGYRNAEEYYDRAGASHVLNGISISTIIITSQDDPFIPYSMFTKPAIQRNPCIRLIAPRYGGHCGFIQRSRWQEDWYWAENRLVEFIVNGS
ncbi:MAG: YheT family hydrolase [Nitrospiraceae bacterium]